MTRPVDHVDIADGVPVAPEQRRQEAMQGIEIGQREECIGIALCKGLLEDVPRQGRQVVRPSVAQRARIREMADEIAATDIPNRDAASS